MADDPFSVRLDRGAYAFGERVRGRILFPDVRHPSLEGVRAINLQVRARVHGSGSSEMLVAHEEQLLQGPPTQEEVPFAARLPWRGPISWQGRHVKVNWEVEATLDIPWAVDPRRVAPFDVKPRRRG